MISGGIAGKLGNRYEAKWLVRHLMDIIAGKADWLIFEGIDTKFQGFEFAIARGAITEWHQTKVNAPKGNWTINALKKEGVLEAFSHRFSDDKNALCYFVSQDNAKDFRSLTEDARTANSHGQYVQVLSKDKKESLQKLKDAWKQPDDNIFDWLKRSDIEIIHERQLDSLIESYGDLYFHEGGKLAFNTLREILENHFNKILTGETVRAAIKSQGILRFKEWAFNPTIQQRLNEETEAYLQTYTPFGAGGETIVRSQVKELNDEIINPNGPELIMLTGIAGSGKSGIIRCAIEQLRELEIPHLAFRIDHYLNCSTREKLGRELTGREEGPVTTLKGTYPSTPAILFIDQVDAISEVSGRDGKVKEVLFRLISDAHNFGGIKVVAVCRTFDLNSDPRLKRLKEADRTKTIEVPLLDWNINIEPLLKNKGIDVSLLNEPQRQLLRLPINLAVFLEIDDPEFSFHSLSTLHEKLIEKKQLKIFKEQKFSWPLIQPLTAMCDWMSQRQRLNAPVSVLDAYPNAVDILTSEGMVILSRSQINFFHESFFDHVYARAFLNHDQHLVDLLTTTEQHLFRRTQVRQILDALRQNDFDRYLIEMSSLLSSDKIRFHIKTAVCQWLNSISKPGEQEFEIISRFDDPGKKFHQCFRLAVLSTHAWFDLLNKKNWVQQQLESNIQERTEMVLHWLKNVSDKRSTEIAHLLRSWWGKNTIRAERLLMWFGLIRHGNLGTDLFRLCEEVINSQPKNLFRDQRRIMMLLHTCGEASPEYCGRILHSLFEALSALNQRHNPLTREDLKTIDSYALTEIANKTPEAFLRGTTDALVHSINMVIAEGKEGKNWYNTNYRTYSGRRSGFDHFLEMYRSSLKEIARSTPELAVAYLEKLDPHKHPCFMHLHLEVVQINPAVFGNRLAKLITSKKVFSAGWQGAEWFSFAQACHQAMPFISSEERNTIEQATLSHTPEIDRAVRIGREISRNGEMHPFWTRKSVIHELNQSGYEQWCILETIGENLLTPIARSRLYKLRRKFPKETIARPDHLEAHFVGSPIKRAKCSKMKDSHWLSAIKQYHSDEVRHYGHDFIDGGARELATELQESTKNDPGRFSALCLKIAYSAHPLYIEHILMGLADAEVSSDELLVPVVRYAHHHPDKPFGIDIAQLLEKHPHMAENNEVLDILIWYALNGEANEKDDLDEEIINNETITIDDLINKSRAHTRGMNGARGWAWETLGAILWEVPNAESRVWDTIEIALEKESSIGVRCCMMTPLVPLFNMDKKRFSAFIRRLIILPDNTPYQLDSLRLSPIITHAAIRLFPYIFHQLPKLADELTVELLESGDETKELIGAWLIFRESFRNDDYLGKADNLALVSIDHRRLLAGVTVNAIIWAENRYRAKSLLKKFFFDDDLEIQNRVANVFRNAQGKDDDLYKELATVFIKSPAFNDNSYSVLRMLEYSTCGVLDLVVEATQRIVKDIMEKGNQYGQRDTDVYHIADLLKREYISSESNTEARKKILDLIDLMLIHEIYGVEDIVTTHDRW